MPIVCSHSKPGMGQVTTTLIILEIEAYQPKNLNKKKMGAKGIVGGAQKLRSNPRPPPNPPAYGNEREEL